jgi:carbon monoxide dehydrogenase subunit G
LEVENSFTVNAPVSQVWTYLLDVQAVAPCVPGAQLTEIVSDTEFRGTVTVKLGGAVKVSYNGTVTLTEVNEVNHRVVLVANGSETRGAGGANATVTSTLSEENGTTTVNIVSEITVSGRFAQFGRNIIQDVSNKLIKEFATCLESTIQSNSTSESSTEPFVEAESVENAGSASSKSEDPSRPEQESQSSDQSTSGVDSESTEGSTGTGPDFETQSNPSQGSASSGQQAQPADINILPIVLEVTRSRIAHGLRRIAKALEPESD